MNTSARVFGLDLIRVTAIFSVVFGHCSFILDKTSPGFPDIPMLNGVDIFFVLSGFLIGTILLKTFEQHPQPGFSELKKFWIRRWFRTIPLYYLILLINIWFAYNQWTTDDINSFDLSFFFFLQNFAWPFQGFFWESWSLTVEEWFYIFFPLFTVFLLHLLSALSVKKIFLFSSISFIVAVNLGRIFMEPHIPKDEYMFSIMLHKVVIFRLDSIIYGVLGAYLSFYHQAFWKKYRYLFLALGLGILYGMLLTIKPDYSLWYYRTIAYTVNGLAILMLFPFFSTLTNLDNRFVNLKAIEKITEYFSKISYSMYLLNLGIIASFISKNITMNNSKEEITMYLLYWAILISASTLLYYGFEKPITQLRDRLA